jgi:outer membrane receptor protein involved in Fe transport
MKRKLLIIFFFILIEINIYSKNFQDQQKLLTMSLQDLMNIKVTTASKVKEEIKDIPASIVLINREEIKKQGYKSLSDILQNIPGFYMINDYYWLGSENFGIRGFFSPGVFNDIIILVNGVNQVGDSYSDYSLAKINVPVEAIDKIEVVRGPMSVLYGSGAFFGAVNIITNHTPVSMISASYGSDKYRKMFLRVSKKSDNFKFTINTSIYGDNGIDKSFNHLTNNHQMLKWVGLSEQSRTKGMLKNDRKYFNFSGEYKNLSFDFSYSNTRKGIFDGLPSYPPGTFLNNRSATLFLKYKKEILKKLSISGKFTYLFDSFFWEYEILKKDSYATNYNNSLSDEIEFNLTYKPNNSLNIVSGFIRHNIFYLYKTYDYPIYPLQYTNTEDIFPDDIISDAFFTQLNYKFTDKLKIVTGLRLEKLYKYRLIIHRAKETPLEKNIVGEYSQDDFKFIPRIALIYTPSKFHSLKLLYGKAVKNPSVIQNMSQLFNRGTTLSPAYIETFELNYILSPSPSLFANISLYQNNLDDLIVKRNIYNPQTQTWEIHSTNSGKMKTSGIEVGVKLLPLQKLVLSMNLSYQKTTNIEKGFENISPGYAPELLGYLKINYSFGDWVIAFVGRYVGDMDTLWDKTIINQEQNIERGRIGQPSKAYYELDFNISVENFIFKKVYLDFHIYNLLNSEIIYPTTSGNSWAEKGTYGYGRLFIISMGKYF